MMYPYGYGPYNMMWPITDWWFALDFLVFIFVVIFMIVAYRSYLKHTGLSTGSPGALDIAKMRLAKGEITLGQFEEMKKHLQ